jgi:hypothetical protein
MQIIEKLAQLGDYGKIKGMVAFTSSLGMIIQACRNNTLTSVV